MVRKEFKIKEEIFIPESLDEAISEYPYLSIEIDKIRDEFGETPIYVAQPTRDLSIKKELNIIYPVGGPVFINVRWKEASEKEYIVLEPPLTDRIKKIINILEMKLMEIAENIKPPRDENELREFLYNYINKTLTTERKKRIDQIYVAEEEKKYIFYFIFKDKVGNGLLEPLMRDPYLEDIHGLGLGNIYVTHTIFGMLKTNIKFEDEFELNKFLVKLAEMSGRPITYRKPIVDAIMPDGSRLNIIYGKETSLRGSSFTIRKFTKKPISIIQLVKWGTLSPEMAAYFWLAFEFGMNILICGETASGKTTLLKALISFIRPDAKVYSVEETPEIYVPHETWQRLVGKPLKESGEEGVDMYDLLKAALRSRPDYIIIGEIRGKEGYIAFQAAQTGHPIASTFHAGSIRQVIQRLTGDPIRVPRPFIDNLNIVAILRIQRKGNIIYRRVVSVYEIERYIPETDSIMTREVFVYSPATDTFRFRGRFNSYILEKKIAPILGYEDPRKIYEELDKRAKIIREMVIRNIVDYFEVFEIFKKYYYFKEEGLPFKLV